MKRMLTALLVILLTMGSPAAVGADDPSNMQWQTVADAKAKDKWERKQARNGAGSLARQGSQLRPIAGPKSCSFILSARPETTGHGL